MTAACSFRGSSTTSVSIPISPSTYTHSSMYVCGVHGEVKLCTRQTGTHRGARERGARSESERDLQTKDTTGALAQALVEEELTDASAQLSTTNTPRLSSVSERQEESGEADGGRGGQSRRGKEQARNRKPCTGP
jgi:hypothetical protein